MTLPDKNLLTIQQAAKFLGVSAKTLRRWETSGFLTPQRTIGNQRRYTLEELQNLKQSKPKYQSPKITPIPEGLLGGGKQIPIAIGRRFDSPEVAGRKIGFLPASFLFIFIIAALTTLQVVLQTDFQEISDYFPKNSPAQKLISPFLAVQQKMIASNIEHLDLNKNLKFKIKNFDTPSILSAQSGIPPDFVFNVNVPANFTKDVDFKGSITAAGSAFVSESVKTHILQADNVVYSLIAGDGIEVASGQTPKVTNTGVISLAGKTGALKLEAGTGITVDGLKITAKDISLVAGDGISVSGYTITNTAKVFKTISVSGQSNITASSLTDTLTFAGGTGITLTTSDKTLTITGSGSALNVSGWYDDGTIVRLVTSTDSVGIGTTNPSTKLHVVGTTTLEGAAAVSSGGLSVTGGLNNNSGGITNAGPITGATGFTSSGTITLSGLSTGLVHANFSGVLSSSAVNLASSDVTGTLSTTSGGTGLASYTKGDLLWASAANTLANLGVGSSNQVLTVGASNSLAWASVTGGGGLCSNCIVNDPGSTQTITPTAIGATGLIVAQASSGNVDVFAVTNNGAATKYFSINSSGDTIFKDSTSFDSLKISPVAAGASSKTGTITSADLTDNRTWTLPNATGNVCLDTGNCAGQGSNIGGSGTANYITRWSGQYALENSSIFDNGNIGIGTTSPGYKLAVVGTGNFTSSLGVGSTLTVTGASILQSTLSVTGAADLNSTLGVTGATTLSSTVNITGLTTIGGAINVNGLANSWISGNVGIGTTSPAGALHVVGSCVTGDTLLKRKRRRKKRVGANHDSPDEWEEYWEDVPIKDIQEGDEILTFDETTGEFIPSKVEGLMYMGVKEAFALVTQSGKKIETTDNHPYLVLKTATAEKVSKKTIYEVDQSVRIEEVTKDTILGIANKEHSKTGLIKKDQKQLFKKFFQKTLRTKNFAPTVFALALIELLVSSKLKVTGLVIDTEYNGYEKLISDIIHKSLPEITLYFRTIGHKSLAHFAVYGVYIGKRKADSILKLPQKDQKRRGRGGLEAQRLPSCRTVTPQDKSLTIRSPHYLLPYGDYNTEWTAVKYLKLGDVIATTDGWEKISACYPTGRKKVYDIQVFNTHNFVGNGIIAHNTYIMSGNVGIGTTNPLQKLHVEGQCVATGTLINIRRRRRRRRGEVSSPENDWEELLIPVEDVLPGDEVLSLNEKSGEFEWQEVEKTMDKGTQNVFEITTSGQKRIAVTDQHPFFVINRPQITPGVFEVDLSIHFGDLTRPTYVAIAKNSSVTIARIDLDVKKEIKKLAQKSGKAAPLQAKAYGEAITAIFKATKVYPGNILVDNDYTGLESPIRDTIKEEFPDAEVNFGTISDHSLAHIGAWEANKKTRKSDFRLEVVQDNKKSGQGSHLAILRAVSLGVITKIRRPHDQLIEPSYYSDHDLSRGKWVKEKSLSKGQYLATETGWEKITGIRALARKQTFDLQIANTHNFTANGIVAHNTYLSGNVGIGTTGPDMELVVSSNDDTRIVIQDLGATNDAVLEFTKGSGSAQTWGIGLDYSNNYALGIGYLANNHPSLTTNNLVTITTTGNVGIGTTAPGTLLDVRKDQNNITAIRVRNDTSGTAAQAALVASLGNYSQYLSMNTYSTGYTTSGLIAAGSSIIVSEGDTAGLRIFTRGATNLTLGTNNAANVTIQSGGNVGIGTTAPSSLLDVNGTAWLRGTGTSGLFVNSSGNVGVGTTAPAGKLHILGSCLTGDSLLPLRRKRKSKIKDQKSNIDEEFEYLLCPITDVHPGDEVLSLNTATESLEYARINKLMDMGVQEVYELTTKSGKVIRTTSNHPFLTKKNF